MADFDKHNDPLQDLLRQYLLEKEAGEGSGLLEKLSQKALEAEPEVVMPEQKRAEMIRKLRQAMDKPAGGGNASGGGSAPWSKWIIPSATTIIGILILLWFFLPTDPSSENPQPVSSSETVAAPVNPDFTLHPASQTPPANLKTAETDPHPFSVQHNLPQASTQKPVSDNPATKLSYGVPVQNDLQPAPVDLPSPLLQLIAFTQLPFEERKYDPASGLLFPAKGGTLLYFPAHCFANPDGTPVTGPVTIRVRESNSHYAALRNHIGTHTTADEILESGGMFTVEAACNGKPLKIARGMSYYAEFTYAGSKPMMLYEATENAFSTRWQLAQRQDKVLVPLPVGSINFSQFMSPVRGNREWDALVSSLNQSKFQGTFIATREFVQRLSAMRKLNFPAEILELYMDNTSSNLYEVDQMVVYRLRGNPRAMNEMTEFEAFARQGLKKPVAFNHYGVDLKRGDARAALESRGASTDEIESTLLTAAVRDEILKEINDPINTLIDRKLPHEDAGFIQKIKMAGEGGQNVTVFVWGTQGRTWAPLSRSTGYSIPRLGTWNLDCIAQRPVKYDFDITVPPEITQHNAKAYLFSQQSEVVLCEGKFRGDGKISFDNVPLQSGRVVVMGNHMGQTWYGERTVQSGGFAQAVEMKVLSRDELIAAIDKFKNW